MRLVHLASRSTLALSQASDYLLSVELSLMLHFTLAAAPYTFILSNHLPSSAATLPLISALQRA
jgi:hypothetical protein